MRVSHRQLINSNPPISNEIGGFFMREIRGNNINKELLSGKEDWLKIASKI